MISVVIPTYNRAQYLKEAIESVLKQTLRDFEIIVVDDGSTDNTKEVLSHYGGRIRPVFQENRERAAARNNGVRHAKGNYIAFLDSDDIWLPDHLKVCLDALVSNQDAGLSFSGSYIMDENGKTISKTGLKSSGGYLLRNIVSKFSAGGCNASSCLIKKEIFDKAGSFNEDRDLSGSEDWEMWARVASHAKLVSTNAYTVKIRFHAGRSSLKAEGMARSMKRAMDTIYENPNIAQKVKTVKREAYSSLHSLTAIHYYASGDMKTAQKYIWRAAVNYPLSVFTNKYILHTLLRSVLGPKLSLNIRKVKWGLTSVLYTN